MARVYLSFYLSYFELKMGVKVHFVVTIILILNLVFTIERFVFDALGCMWLPLAFNILDVILTFIALHGVITRKIWPFIIYIPWCIIWLLLNIFVLLAYQNIINFTLVYRVLKLASVKSISWWYSNGLHCDPSVAIGNSLDMIVANSSSKSLLPSLLQLRLPADVHVWLRPANQTDGTMVKGLCIPDYRLVESVQAGSQVFFAILLIFCCTFFIIRKRQTKKLEICHGDLTFVSMQRDTPGEKLTFTSKDFYTRTNQSATHPLLGDLNDTHRVVVRDFNVNNQNQKSGSSTTTQSTRDSSPPNMHKIPAVAVVVPTAVSAVTNRTWDPKAASGNQLHPTGGTLNHHKRSTPYSSSSLTLNHQSVCPRQLAQLQEYSRRIAKIQQDQMNHHRTSASSSTKGTRHRGNEDEPFVASPTMTTETSISMDQSEREGRVTQSLHHQTNNLFDIFHPRQESAPVVSGRQH